MRKVQAKRFDDKFHRTPCQLGNWTVGGPPLPSIAERIDA
jgi:hypothetical protein